MKRKTLTLTLSLLACFALIGVGFASWIITSQSNASGEGNFVVDTVNDKRLNVVTQWVDPTTDENLEENPSIVYGKKDGGPRWLTSDGADENLTAKLKVTVTKKDGSEFADENDLNVVASISADDAYSTAQESNYVAALPNLDEVTPKMTLSEDKKSITIEYTITFEWGTEFGGKNPMDYYKEQEDDINASEKTTAEKAILIEELKDEASANLSGLYHDLHSDAGVHFILNLTISLE